MERETETINTNNTADGEMELIDLGEGVEEEVADYTE